MMVMVMVVMMMMMVAMREILRSLHRRSGLGARKRQAEKNGEEG